MFRKTSYILIIALAVFSLYGCKKHNTSTDSSQAACAEGFHSCRAVDCESTCEPDDVAHCSDHETKCAETVSHWISGKCEHARCIPEQCDPGYHAVYPLGICEADDKTACTPADCLSANPKWKTAECISGTCKATDCINGYHVENGDCIINSSNPACTLTDCLSAHPLWKTAECVSDTCKAKSCIEGYQLSHGDCIKTNKTAQPPLSSCIYQAYPAVCVDNTGFICGQENSYYSNKSTRCGAGDRCILCQNGRIGCGTDRDAYCASFNSKPIYDPNICRTGHRRCEGRKLMECDGTSYSILVENCSQYCTDAQNGNNSSCSNSQPICTLKNGVQAELIAWNDGDTAYLRPLSSDNSCDSGFASNNFPHVRILGIDAPECTKSYSSTYGKKVCIQDNNYSNTNDPYGYDAWQYATEHFPPGSTVTVWCDEHDEYNNCPKDSTSEQRTLVFLESNGQDYSSTLIGMGLAMPNIRNVPLLSPQEKSICQNLMKAISNGKNLYSHCSSNETCVKNTASKLRSSRPNEFDKMYDRCQYILDMMK